MQVEFENKSKSHQPQTFLAGQTQKESKELVCAQGGKTKVASLTGLASTLLRAHTHTNTHDSHTQI